MTPYYEQSGVTIYHGADRVKYRYEAWTEEGLQAIGGTYREEDEVGRGSSCVAGR